MIPLEPLLCRPGSVWVFVPLEKPSFSDLAEERRVSNKFWQSTALFIGQWMRFWLCRITAPQHPAMARVFATVCRCQRLQLSSDHQVAQRDASPRQQSDEGGSQSWVAQLSPTDRTRNCPSSPCLQHPPECLAFANVSPPLPMTHLLALKTQLWYLRAYSWWCFESFQPCAGLPIVSLISSDNSLDLAMVVQREGSSKPILKQMHFEELIWWMLVIGGLSTSVCHMCTSQSGGAPSLAEFQRIKYFTQQN